MRLISEEITDDMIKQALALDRKYYPSQYWLSLEQCLGYYNKNNTIYMMLLDNDKVIGYLNFSPICEKKYKDISLGKCLDTTIEPKDIETYSPNSTYYAYLSSVVVDEKYRKQGFGNLFVSALSKKIALLYAQKIYISRIVADVLNELGEKLASNFGLHKKMTTLYHSTIYEAELLPSLNLLPTTHNQALIEAYKHGE